MREWDEKRDEQERAMLSRARAAMGPAAARKRAVLSSFTAGIGLPSLPSSAGPNAVPPLAPESLAPPLQALAPLAAKGAASGVHLVSIKWIAAGLMSATSLGFGAVYLVAAPPPVPSKTQTAEESRTAAMTQAPVRATPKAAVAPVVLEQGLDAREPSALKRAPKVTPGSKAAATTKDEAKSSFYEELSYIRRAQSALQEGNAVLALGLMTSLDEILPRGALLVERNMTKVLALCQLERADEAIAIASRTLQSPSAEVYRGRLEGSCAGDAARSAPQDEGSSADEIAVEGGKRQKQ